MDLKHWTCEIDDQGIAWVQIDVMDKSVNVLTRDVVTEMAAAAEYLESADGIKAMALMSAKPVGFVYGADINEFEVLATEADVAALLEEVHATFVRFASLPYPTVAGIDGYALGGGLELALTCDRLVMTNSPKTQVGFPEVKLGLMPGYGGTGRAYGRVGAMMVLDMMLSGRMVGAGEALEAGLVDALAQDRDSLKNTLKDVLAAQNGVKPERNRIEGEDTAAVVEEVKAKFLKRTRPDHTPAPYAIIDHVANHAPDAAAISAAEQDIFPSMMMSAASKGLRRNFQLTDMVRRSARGDAGIASVHVIGAGVMGGDIAAVAAMSGLTVTLSDMSADAINGAVDRARVLYERRLKTPDAINAAMDRLIADKDGDGINTADLIIEAVAERLDVKKAVFEAVEKSAKADAILATNTSAIPLEQIAAALTNPSRLIGLHFFNPVPVLPLVEVIWSTYSHEDAIAKGMQFAGQMKKMPIKCKSSPGFVVNRALIPYINAGLEMMLEGGDADKIDQALVEFGMPMGPVELADQIGLDVMYDASGPLGMPEIVEKTLKDMVDAGTIGRKSGSGFYTWVEMKADRPRKAYDPKELSDIATTLLAPMVRECQAAVDEGTVESADHADAAMIFGVGYPAFRGGPLFHQRQ